MGEAPLRQGREQGHSSGSGTGDLQALPCIFTAECDTDP